MKKFILAAMLLFAATTAMFAYKVNIPLRNGNTMTLEICSDNIVRVQIYSGSECPQALMERYGILKTDWVDVNVKVNDTNDNFTVSTDKCTVVVNKADGSVSLNGSDGSAIVEKVSFIGSADPSIRKMGEDLNKRFIKFSKKGAIIGDDAAQELNYDETEVGDFAKNSALSITLADGERFYGGGNTSREHIQHRGEVLRMWATYQHTEIPMPFVVSSNKWGIFNNTTVRNYFDIGATQKDRMVVYNTCPTADYYLFAGESMLDVIDLYTTVTGKTFVLPRWAYGLAFGGHMHENMFEMMGDAVRFRDEQIPCDLFWIEPQWMAKRYDFSTSKNWNYQKFPGEPYWLEKSTAPKKEHPQLFVGRLHAMGYHLALWLCIDFDQSLVEEDKIAEKLNLPTSGQEHWFEHLNKFVDQGVDGFKLDPARTLDEHPDRQYYNNLTDKEMHNLNQILMPKQMYTTFRDHASKRSFHHYCGGYSGTQHWSASQSGDNGGGLVALFDQLNLSFSGYMNTSCDIMSSTDGFEMESLHMGMFLPWAQINSWFSLRHPWYFSQQDRQIYKNYVQLRYSFLPYIYSAALRCTQNAHPMLMAMPLAFPNDRNCDDMVFQFMFGDDLLVGAFNDSIYLPKGVWHNFWTGERVEGKAATESFDYPRDRAAGHLFVRDGAIIPFQKPMLYSNERPIDTLVMGVWPAKEAHYDLYEDDGVTYAYEDGAFTKTTFSYTRSGNILNFNVEPVVGSYNGMYTKRVYEMEVHIDSKPKRVAVEGIKIRSWRYEDGVLRFSINHEDTSKKISATIYF